MKIECKLRFLLKGNSFIVLSVGEICVLRGWLFFFLKNTSENKSGLLQYRKMQYDLLFFHTTAFRSLLQD